MPETPYQLEYYLDDNGNAPFLEWLYSLRDKVAVYRIRARLDRVELGNFGTAKPVGDGVSELKIDHGPGYRVYYAMNGKSVVLLLIGGDKSTQQKDIETAKTYWKRQKEE
jgi:putative addiction module killer protein